MTASATQEIAENRVMDSSQVRARILGIHSQEDSNRLEAELRSDPGAGAVMTELATGQDPEVRG
ncbi:hypothetical protein NL533_31390, partial [Klebsiella pneumoniae]|nr:hypothetical protein [Klebsiella pneumoniae]